MVEVSYDSRPYESDARPSHGADQACSPVGLAAAITAMIFAPIRIWVLLQTLDRSRRGAQQRRVWVATSKKPATRAFASSVGHVGEDAAPRSAASVARAGWPSLCRYGQSCRVRESRGWPGAAGTSQVRRPTARSIRAVAGPAPVAKRPATGAACHGRTEPQGTARFQRRGRRCHRCKTEPPNVGKLPASDAAAGQKVS